MRSTGSKMSARLPPPTLSSPWVPERAAEAARLRGRSCGCLSVCRHRGLHFAAGADGASRGTLLRGVASARRCIVLGCLCPRVEDLEASVGRCAQLQKVARIRPGKISDELLRNVVSGAAFARKMKLPKGLEPKRLFDDVPGRRRTSLCGAVIHDGHAGSDAVHQRVTPALAQAMVRNDIDVNCTQLVHRTHQFHLLVPREVAQIQNPQLPKRNDCAERE